MSEWTPSRTAIAALLDLLPALAREPETHWSEAERVDGITTMPVLGFDEAERLFVARAREHGWVYPFDWPEWQDRAELYVAEPERLKTAPPSTIRKLITTHVRKERFCEGHLRAMRIDGHLHAILLRLSDFLDDAPEASFDP